MKSTVCDSLVHRMHSLLCSLWTSNVVACTNYVQCIEPQTPILSSSIYRASECTDAIGRLCLTHSWLIKIVAAAPPCFGKEENCKLSTMTSALMELIESSFEWWQLLSEWTHRKIALMSLRMRHRHYRWHVCEWRRQDVNQSTSGPMKTSSMTCICCPQRLEGTLWRTSDDTSCISDLDGSFAYRSNGAS